MKINLESLKSSGVYTFEYDASQTTTTTTEYGRLIIGSSKTGPFNTIVQLQNTAQLRAVYGYNDRLLEKKGSYFHKSCEVSLREGPVYAMNVLPINTSDSTEANPDCGYVAVVNTDSSSVKCAENLKTPLMYLFDRQKFWKASTSAITHAKNSEYGYKPLNAYKNKFLTFSNSGQKTVTIFILKSSITGYDLTVSEWYKSQGSDVYVPQFLDDDDLISDYMVNIIAVEGDWTNYKKLASDSTYSRYFTRLGLRKNKVNEFVQLKTVNVLANVNGSLIPDFKDDRGSIIDVSRLFNNYYTSSSLICSIDADALDSYNQIDPEMGTPVFSDDDIKTQRIDLIGNGTMDIENNKNKFVNVASYKLPIKQVNDVVAYATPIPPEDYDGVESYVEFIGEGTGGSDVPTTLVALEGSFLYELYNEGFLNNTDKVINENGEVAYIKINEYDAYMYKMPGDVIERPYRAIEVFTYEDITLANMLDSFFVEGSKYSFDSVVTSNGDLFKAINVSDLNYIYDPATPNVITFDLTEDYLKATESTPATDGRWFKTDGSYTDEMKEYLKYIKVNQYLKADVENGLPRMLKITNVAKTIGKDKETGIFSATLKVTTLSPIMDNVHGIFIGGLKETEDDRSDDFIIASKGIQGASTAYVGYKISPFKIRETLLPNGGDDRVNEIMKFLFEGSNLAAAITESEDIDIRYLIDTYDGEISESSKYWHSKLAATHGKCAVFTNAPSFRQFEQSQDPKFIDQTTGLVSTQYIADGGNLDLNPTFTYKFASDTVNGIPIESFVFPCTPYLTINDGGVKKSMIPAPYVCNAYMRKFEAGAPYVIVAGQTGKITDSDVIGVEYEFTKTDRDYLEPAGYNLIVKKRREGIMLFSNNTAYQSVKSALNNAHVRDCLITIEKNIERILYGFLFRYNTAVVRARVKSLVDTYLDNVLMAGGVASYSTQIDDSNNDQYVLENNAAVIDITIDFNRGIHKFVNKITISRVGGELSVVQSGFSDL